jgi:hypothetical protein
MLEGSAFLHGGFTLVSEARMEPGFILGDGKLEHTGIASGRWM